jgi:hypothetical protein
VPLDGFERSHLVAVLGQVWHGVVDHGPGSGRILEVLRTRRSPRLGAIDATPI